MKLSIITINYNNCEGLKKTVASVMSQTWRDFEWIIIDGGSTDGSKEVIEEVAANPESNITFWCSEPDKGIYNAMNKGITHAKGDFLNFMNSGDCYYESITLENVTPRLTDNYDVFIGDIIWDKSKIVVRQNPDKVSILEIAINRAFLHQASFIRKSIQEKHLYDEEFRIVSDWKFYIESLIIENAKCLFLNTIICKMEDMGISSTNKDLQLIERKKVLENCFSSSVLQELRNYYYLKSVSIVENTEYLRVKNHKLYVIARRIVSLLVKIEDLLHQKK